MPELRSRKEWQQLLDEWRGQAERASALGGVVTGASLATPWYVGGLKEGIPRAAANLPSWGEAREMARRAAVERGEDSYNLLQAAGQWGRGALGAFGEGMEHGARTLPGGRAVTDIYQQAVDRAAQEGVSPWAILGADVLVPGPDMAAIKAFHGSPHTFSKFDINKLGSGEGAAAFGRGLYFAEAPGVAKDYARRLGRSTTSAGKVGDAPYSPDNPVHAAARRRYSVNRIHRKSDVEVAQQYRETAAQYRAEAEGKTEWADRERALADARWQDAAADALERGDVPEYKPTKPEGGLYEVTLDVDHEDLLDWDLPFDEQPPKVKAALEKLIGSDTPKGVGNDIIKVLREQGVDPWSLIEPGRMRKYRERGDEGLSTLLSELARYSSGSLGKTPSDAFGPGGFRLGNPQWAAPEASHRLKVALGEGDAAHLMHRAEGASGLNSGETVYRKLQNIYGSEEAAVQALQEAGIPGLRFLDQMSRPASKGPRPQALLTGKGELFRPRGQTEIDVVEGARVAGGLSPYIEEMRRTVNRFKEFAEQAASQKLVETADSLGSDVGHKEALLRVARRLEKEGVHLGDKPLTRNIVMFGDELIEIDKLQKGVR